MNHNSEAKQARWGGGDDEDTVSRDKCKEGEGGERNCETETARGRKNANTLIQSCKTNFRSIFF